MNARCDFMGCKELKTQSFATGNKCTQPQIAKEPLDGCKSRPNPTPREVTDDQAGLETLPGNMTVTYA